MNKRVGYLDHGSDFDGTLATAEKASKYLVTIGMYPVLDKFLDKNRERPFSPVTDPHLSRSGLEHNECGIHSTTNVTGQLAVYHIGPPSYTNLATLAVKLLTARVTGQDGHDAVQDLDFMDHYIEAKKQYPEIVDDVMLTSCELTVPVSNNPTAWAN